MELRSESLILERLQYTRPREHGVWTASFRFLLDGGVFVSPSHSDWFRTPVETGRWPLSVFLLAIQRICATEAVRPIRPDRAETLALLSVSGFRLWKQAGVLWGGTGAGRTSTADARSAVLASISGSEERTGTQRSRRCLSSAKERVTRIGR